MTMLRYDIQTGANGSIVIPTTPFAVGEQIEVVLLEKYRDDQPLDDEWRTDPTRLMPNGKTPVEDFLNFCEELNLPPMTDEEVEQAKFDYLMEKYG